MKEVEFFETAGNNKVKYVVIAARYRGKWILCKHKRRSTYEMPGGHIEDGEEPAFAARRELFEETGAVEFEIFPVSVYKVDDYGVLYYADVKRLDDLPDFEMEGIYFFDRLPDKLTYPSIHPKLFEKVGQFLNNNRVENRKFWEYMQS